MVWQLAQIDVVGFMLLQAKKPVMTTSGKGETGVARTVQGQ